jgi:hypothetical protein
VDGTARVWNAANGQLVAKLEVNSKSIESAAFSQEAVGSI